MENEVVPDSLSSQQLNKAPLEQSTFWQYKKNLLFLILATFFISAVVFGIGGYYLGMNLTENHSQQTPPKVTVDNTQLIVPSMETSTSAEYIIEKDNEGNELFFRNEVFSFKYPPTVILNKDENLVDNKNIVEIFINPVEYYPTPAFVVSNQEPAKKFSLPDKIRTESNPITINGINATKIKHIYLHGEITEVIFEKNGSNIYFQSNYDDLSAMTIFENIINTFQFN